MGRGRADSKAKSQVPGARTGKDYTGLKAQFRIGSIHGRANYGFDEKAFHKSEIPQKALQAKREIRAAKRGNRLGLNKEPWNGSTYTTAHKCVRDQHQLSAHDAPLYQHNYRAEKLPDKRPPFVPKATHLEFDQRLLIADPKVRAMARTLAPSKDTQEMPVHPNLEGKALWDNSTSNQTRLPIERARKMAADDKKLKDYRKRNPVQVPGYLGPAERERNSMRKMRETKKLLREKPYLASTDEAGNVTILQDGAAGRSKARAKKGNVTFKPYKTTVSRKYKTYEHSGVYEYNQVEKMWMWSDTASEMKNGRGDIVKTHNPDAWNFADGVYS
jgi:hypothetical protein